jgi:hypothetical protein
MDQGATPRRGSPGRGSTEVLARGTIAEMGIYLATREPPGSSSRKTTKAATAGSRVTALLPSRDGRGIRTVAMPSPGS